MRSDTVFKHCALNMTVNQGDAFSLLAAVDEHDDFLVLEYGNRNVIVHIRESIVDIEEIKEKVRPSNISNSRGEYVIWEPVNEDTIKISTYGDDFNLIEERLSEWTKLLNNKFNYNVTVFDREYKSFIKFSEVNLVEPKQEDFSRDKLNVTVFPEKDIVNCFSWERYNSNEELWDKITTTLLQDCIQEPN